MRAFLEQINKDWLDEFVYLSKYPLIDMGIKVIPFDGNNIDTLLKHNINSKTDIIIGSTQTAEIFFKECGIKVPEYLGYPSELSQFLHRNISIIKYCDIKHSYPYFIKPKKEVKMFTGSLVENDTQYKILKDYCSCKDDTELYISEPVDFITEYRCFVHKGKLVGMKHYKGDFTKFVCVETIQAMIEAYKTCPVAYTLDVGLVDYKTVLCEVNDFIAIGSYSFNPKIYVRMTLDRFKEILKR